MNYQLTPQDWELLSALLDGSLSPAEQRRSQAVMARRPELGLALEELRRTRAVLRAAPRRRVPRNFTLTPAMARQAKPRFSFHFGWVPSLGFASALATLLLLFSFFVRLPAPTLMAAAPAPMAVQAPQAAPAARAMEQSAPGEGTPSPIIIWNAGGLGGGPASGADLASTPPEAAAQVNPIAPGVTTPEKTAPDVPAATPAAKSAMTLAPVPLDAAAGGNGPILGVAPADQRGRILTTTPALASPALRDRSGSLPAADAPDGWGWVQAGLGLVALLSGLAALGLWWRARH